MKAICGANCNECELLKNRKCRGCDVTNGCPFGHKCWISKYLEVSKEEFELFKSKLIDEFNNLNVEGMPKITELYPLHGSFVNLECPLPSGKKAKLIDDNESYLGNQVACIFSDNTVKRYFGLLANMSFLMIYEYGENVNNPELILYKKR